MRWIPRIAESLVDGPAPGPDHVPFENAASVLASELNLAPPVAALLASRGITDPTVARKFLNPTLKDLHSPYEMLGMRKAVERLSAAIERGERMLIYGDYDVDGTMATVILKTAIELCGGKCDFHVPHRLLEGYGMRDEVIERAAADGVRLIISVDTGIRAFAAAETSKRLGLDLIVTDHHLPHEDRVPEAIAVLNPNQKGCTYGCKFLCGAGVAFKVAQALLEKNGKERLIASFLKVVAIATIADAVPLTGENRVFVKLGLEGLRNPVNAGLRALMEISELRHGRTLTSTDVAFRIAPRMNAAGRMDVAKDVIDLFTVKDQARAREIAEHLNRLNGDRQQEEARITESIHERIASDAALHEASCLVVDGEGWHRGVIGICASRVVDRYCRPALVITRDGEEAHGSGRSIAAFHLLDALESCADLFTRFGGHAHAVGFALPASKIEELRVRLDAYAKERLADADFEKVLAFDAELSLDEITPKFWEGLQQMEPFGMGNPEPVFVSRAVRTAGDSKILKEKHLKLRLHRYNNGVEASRYSRTIEALGWRMASRLQDEPIHAGDVLDVAFRVEQNTYNDIGGTLQLVLCDYGISQHAAAAVRG